MENKKYYCFLIILFSIATVSALTEGQIITQTQLNNYDVINHKFDANWTNTKQEFISSCFPLGVCIANFEYLTIEEYNDSYIVILKRESVSINLFNFILKKNRYSLSPSVVKVQILQEIKSQVRKNFNIERNHINKFKESIDTSLLPDFPNLKELE